YHFPRLPGLVTELAHQHARDLYLEVFRRLRGQFLFGDERVLCRFSFEGGDNLLRLSFPYPLQLLQVLYRLLFYEARYLPDRPCQRPDCEGWSYILHGYEKLEKLLVQL